jgi:hypothetical protein
VQKRYVDPESPSARIWQNGKWIPGMVVAVSQAPSPTSSHTRVRVVDFAEVARRPTVLNQNAMSKTGMRSSVCEDRIPYWRCSATEYTGLTSGTGTPTRHAPP